MSVPPRPIIDYQGPLFRVLHRLTERIGYVNASLLWQIGAVSWLVLLGGLTLTTRFSRLFTATVLAGVVMLRVPGLGLSEQNVDESQWIVSAATLVIDPHFWQSVDGTTSGPLNVWPPALLYYLGLSLDYTTLRLWGLLTCTLPTVWLLLATYRQQFGERVARFAILPVASCLALTTDSDAVAFNSEQLPMLLLALAGYLLGGCFSGKKSNSLKSPVRLLALGLVLGCLPYTKLQATPIGLVMATWSLAGLLSGAIKKTPGWFGRLGGFVAGGLLPTLCIGSYLLLTSLTDYAVRSYLLANLNYAQDGSWGVGTVSWSDRLLLRLPQIYGSMASTNWFWVFAFLLGLVGLIARSMPPEKNRRFSFRTWFVVSICAVSTYATLQPGNPFAHYQWLAFVPVSWLMALLVHQFLRPIATPELVRRRWPMGVSYFLICLVYPGGLALSRPNPGIAQMATGNWHTLTWPIAEAIRPYARPNERMVIWGWATTLHVETALLLGSRFIPLYFPVVPGPQQAYFLAVYRRDLRTNQPSIIVDAVGVHRGKAYDQYPIRRYPAIQSILDSDYHLVGTVEQARIYVRNAAVTTASAKP